ncbi:MAG: hypothetical protein LQ348_001675 [Seirophora lacunosa]|nr:MAG: hypothetical protein LQ348_001675 [Seirophora lacunosa]
MSRMLCQLKELQPSDDTGMTVPPPGTRRAKTMATPSSAHWATATRQSIRLSQQQWLFEPPVRRVSNHRLAKCTEPTLARGKPRWSRNMGRSEHGIQPETRLQLKTLRKRQPSPEMQITSRGSPNDDNQSAQAHRE